MEEIVLALSQKYPGLMTFFVVLGILRTVFKPLMSILQAVVKETPTLADDHALAKFMSSRAYLGLVWFVDYVSSVKLPRPAPKEDAKP